MYIKNFRTHKAISFTYALDIHQIFSKVDITVMLLKTIFRSKHAIFIRLIDPYGQTIVKVVNCSFSARVGYANIQDNSDCVLHTNGTNELAYGCSDYLRGFILDHDSMIYGYFTFYDITKTNEIQFINCTFFKISNLHTKKLIEFQMTEVKHSVKYLTISMINCLFLSNYNVKLISIERYSNQSPSITIYKECHGYV